jgi:hypothetical protein
MLQMLAPGNVEMIGAPERIGDSALLPALKIKAFSLLRLEVTRRENRFIEKQLIMNN